MQYNPFGKSQLHSFKIYRKNESFLQNASLGWQILKERGTPEFVPQLFMCSSTQGLRCVKRTPSTLLKKQCSNLHSQSFEKVMLRKVGRRTASNEGVVLGQSMSNNALRKKNAKNALRVFLGPREGRTIGPYANSLPLSSQV